MADEVIKKRTPDKHKHVHTRQRAGYEAREEVVENVGAARLEILDKVTSFVWMLFGILEVLIGLRVFLKLIAANPINPFAFYLYWFTDLFLWPFNGLTQSPSAGGIVLEISSLIAMVVYALIGWVIVRLLWLLFYHRPSRRIVRIERRRE